MQKARMAFIRTTAMVTAFIVVVAFAKVVTGSDNDTYFTTAATRMQVEEMKTVVTTTEVETEVQTEVETDITVEGNA